MHAACGTQEVWGAGDRGAGSITRSSGQQEETEVIVERKGKEMGQRSLGNCTLFYCSKSNFNMKDLQFLSQAPFK